MSTAFVTPIAFDPKSPSALILAANSSSDSSQFQLHSFLAEDGVGCNNEETSALMLLLQRREESWNLPGGEARTGTAGITTSTYISQTYRDVVLNCIEQCDLNLLQKQDLQSQSQQQQLRNASDGEENEEELEFLSAQQMELLKLTHTVAYLCEVYLLRPDDDCSTSGIVTAATVRYLRYCHTYPLDQYIAQRMVLSKDHHPNQPQNDLDIMNDMLNSNQPEYYFGPDQSSSISATASTTTTDISPYWQLFRKLILRGQFDMAWAVLSRHSACRRSFDPTLSSSTSNPISQIQREDREAFAILQALLLSAPLPGGRSDDEDDGLGELASRKNNYEDRISMDHDQGEANDDTMTLIPGIPRQAYKLWNANDDFQVQAAMHVYKNWRFHVEQVMKTNAPLTKLLRRIPILESCLFDIILRTKQSFIEDDSWAERLMAELMFVQPEIPKENVHIRASDWIKICSAADTNMEDEKDSIEEILVQIMKGDAGSVIKALKLYGGSSGAALPTTMTALLCSLLVETGRIELSQQTFDIETELIVSAASSILASFSMQNQEGVGVALCTQFLRPHAIPENPIVTAYLAEILSRHFPETDADVISLLQQCIDAVTRGSREILDACDSLVFSRSLHYEQRGELRKAVEMIVRGLEFSCSFGSEIQDMAVKQNYTNFYSYTTCFRRLTIICANLTARVLEQMSHCLFGSDGNSEDESNILNDALKESKGIIEIISSEDVSSLVSFAPSVSLLNYVVDFGWHFFHGDYNLAAASIVDCLKERKDIDGSVIILASREFYGYFLSFAYKILSMEESSSVLSNPSASFDIQGMRVLYCRMTEFCTQDEEYLGQSHTKSVNGSTSSVNKKKNQLQCEISVESLRLALAKGLMRAFIVQNHQLADTQRAMTSSEEPQSSKIWTTNEGMGIFLGPSL